MTETKRAEFPDPLHPLKTPDPAAQAGVVERIKRAMKTGTRKPRGTQPWDGSMLPNRTRYTRVPMGERPKLSNEDVGMVWGVGITTARKRIHHPEKLDVNQAFALTHALGVTIDWLRGWAKENAYGRYEDNAQVVARLYERLSPNDKETVCRLFTSLLNEDAVREVYEDENDAYMDAWSIAHPEVFEPMKEFATQFKMPPEIAATLREMQEYASAETELQLKKLSREMAAMTANLQLHRHR